MRHKNEHGRFPERFCQRRAKVAFTLIELLVVIAIIAVLARREQQAEL
jgi:prepilin-type N-terminal cleavage/methylation domain-containing protein